MGALLQDLRYAIRTWRRAPVVAGAAILSMALGIGANTAIFSLIHTLILRPLPVQAPEELVEPVSWLPGGDAPRANAFAWKHYVHYREYARAFSSVIAASPARLQEGGEASGREDVDVEYIVGNFFPTLGVRPVLGRLPGPEDDRADAPATAAISWTYWQRRFNGDPNVVGQPVVLNGTPVAIVGVAPREFFGLLVGVSPDVWLPMAMEPRTQQPSRLVDASLLVRVMGRLRPGVSIDAAQAEMRVLDRARIEDLVKAAPFWERVQLELESAAAGFGGVRDLFAGPLGMLMVVVAALLLIACANVAGLLLARAAARHREMAVRVAVGAGRGRLVRQLLTESLLLSAIGGAVGIVLAVVGGNLLVRMLLSGRMPPGFPVRFDIQVHADSTVLLFTAAAVIVTGVLFGLPPAVHAWRTAPMSALREAMPGEAPRGRRFGHGLVAAQVALSIVLLSAAGLLLGHVARLKDRDTGFARQRMLLVTLDPTRSGYERPQLFEPYRLLLERLDALPGVEAATLSAVTPIEGPGAARMIDVPGFHEAAEAKRFIPLNFVGPRYFETYDTPLLTGREFHFDDIGRPRVAIVNQAMARYYFGTDSPIGKRFSFTGREGVYEIVGLVGDAKYLNLLDAAPRTIYVHAFQEPRMFTDKLSIRTNIAETVIAADVQHVVEDVLRTGAVAKGTTLDQQMDASIAIERTLALLSEFFGVLGALLAALGLYGLLAYSVARRTREIGIRVALGASRGDVIRMVLGGAGMLVAAGVVVGAPVAFWGQRAAAQLLRGFTVEAPLAIVVAAVEMAVVALAAAYLPARRATRIDPAVALRQD